MNPAQLRALLEVAAGEPAVALDPARARWRGRRRQQLRLAVPAAAALAAAAVVVAASLVIPGQLSASRPGVSSHGVSRPGASSPAASPLPPGVVAYEGVHIALPPGWRTTGFDGCPPPPRTLGLGVYPAGEYNCLIVRPDYGTETLSVVRAFDSARGFPVGALSSSWHGHPASLVIQADAGAWLEHLVVPDLDVDVVARSASRAGVQALFDRVTPAPLPLPESASSVSLNYTALPTSGGRRTSTTEADVVADLVAALRSGPAVPATTCDGRTGAVVLGLQGGQQVVRLLAVEPRCGRVLTGGAVLALTPEIRSVLSSVIPTAQLDPVDSTPVPAGVLQYADSLVQAAKGDPVTVLWTRTTLGVWRELDGDRTTAASGTPVYVVRPGRVTRCRAWGATAWATCRPVGPPPSSSRSTPLEPVASTSPSEVGTTTSASPDSQTSTASAEGPAPRLRSSLPLLRQRPP